MDTDSFVSAHRRGLNRVVMSAGALLVAVLASPLSALAAEEGSGPDRGIRQDAALAGYLAYGLMAAAVVFGILTTTGFARRSISKRAVESTHLAIAMTALTFTFLHATTYVFQSQENFTWLKAFVPFVNGGELEVGLGIIGFELSLAATAAILFQKRLGYRRWHIIHYATYAGFGLSLAHTLTTSPEARAAGAIGAIVFATALSTLLLFILRWLPATTATGTRLALKEL